MEMPNIYPTAKPRILILGNARHGKDTVAEILASILPLKFTSSSKFAQKLIQPALMASVYKDNELVQSTFADLDAAIFADRVNYRDAWKEFIALINVGDPTTLAKLIMEENNIYVGMRRLEEFKACIDCNLFNVVIFVDASQRIKQEDPTNEIQWSNVIDVTYDGPWNGLVAYITNNDTEKELQHVVTKMSNVLADKFAIRPIDATVH